MRQNNLSLVLYNRLIQRQQKANANAGMSLIEILVVVALTAMLAALAAPAITFGNDPLRDTSNRLAGSFKLARARAMAETSAVRIRPLSNTEFVMERATRCAESNPANWTNISDRVQKNGVFINEDLSFDRPTQLVTAKVGTTNTGTLTTVSPVTNWNLCFNSRGTTATIVELTIRDTDTNKQRTMKVYVGGSVELGNIS